MKNPKKIRELTNNFCILDAALSGLSYAEIARYYKISPTRIPQIVWGCIKRMCKRVGYSLGINHIYKRSDLTENKEFVVKLLSMYKNGINTYSIRKDQANVIHYYALNIAKKRRYIIF
jgi:hypothetical protein